MKNLLITCVTVLFIFISSCSNNEIQVSTVCDGDFARYEFDGNLFESQYAEQGGEFLTPSGYNCGIGAAFSENTNHLIINIAGSNQHLNIRTIYNELNFEHEVNSAYYQNDDYTETFGEYTSSQDDFIKITELDLDANTISGEFELKIKNSNSEEMEITNGSFTCFYHEI